jgi:hypothetical protein
MQTPGEATVPLSKVLDYARLSRPNFDVSSSTMRDMNKQFLSHFVAAKKEKEAPSAADAAIEAVLKLFAHGRHDFTTEMEKILESMRMICTVASWSLHSAPRFLPPDSEEALVGFFKCCSSHFQRTVPHGFLKQPKSKDAAEAWEDTVCRALGFAANVLTQPPQTTSPLLQPGPGGGPHKALVRWENIVGAIVGAFEGLSRFSGPAAAGRFPPALAAALAGRAMVREAMAAVAPADPSQAQDDGAFLRSLTFLYDARALQLSGVVYSGGGGGGGDGSGGGGGGGGGDGGAAGPGEPLPDRLQALIAPVLHKGATLHAHVFSSAMGAAVDRDTKALFMTRRRWCPLVPSSLPQHLAVALLRAGRGGDAFRVLHAGASSTTSVTTAISCCVSLAVSLLPRLLLCSPARRCQADDWAERLEFDVMGLPDAAERIYEGGLHASYTEQVKDRYYEHVLGIPKSAPPSAAAAAEEAHAAALLGGAEGATRREEHARYFLLRAAHLLRKFAAGTSMEEDAKSASETGATDFAVHFYPALPLCLAGALNGLGEQREALEALNNAPQVVLQACNAVNARLKKGHYTAVADAEALLWAVCKPSVTLRKPAPTYFGERDGALSLFAAHRRGAALILAAGFSRNAHPELNCWTCGSFKELPRFEMRFDTIRSCDGPIRVVLLLELLGCCFAFPKTASQLKIGLKRPPPDSISILDWALQIIVEDPQLQLVLGELPAPTSAEERKGAVLALLSQYEEYEELFMMGVPDSAGSSDSEV